MMNTRLQFMLNFRSKEGYESDWLARNCRLPVMPNGMEIFIKNNMFIVERSYIDLERQLMVVTCKEVIRTPETGDTWDGMLKYYFGLGFYLLGEED